MTIERRIGITAGVLILSVLGTGLMLFGSSHQVADGIKQAQASSRIVRSAFMLRTLMDEYLMSGEKRPLRQWNKEQESIGQILNNKSLLSSADPTLIEDLENKYLKVTSLSRQAMQLTVYEESEEHHQNLEVKRQIIYGMLYRSLEELAKAADDLSMAILAATLSKRTFVGNLIMATGLAMMVIILINIYLIGKSVVHPLKALSAGAEKIGAGDFDYVQEIKSDDEVGKLGQAFNTMIDRVQERTTALRKARDELELKVEKRTAELRAASAYNRSLFEASLDPLVTISVDGKITDVNTSTKTVTGCSRDELIGTDFARYFTDPQKATDGYRQVFADGSVKDYELEIRHKDGHVTPVMYNASLYLDESGQTAGLFAAARDITERKETEKLRKEALETADILNKIFSTTHFCIVFLDKDFNFISVNQAYADSCGHPTDFFPGKNHFDLYPHEENERIFRQVIETGETFSIYAKPFEFPDDPDRGVTYWDWTLHPVKDAQGRVEELIFILLDVTDRKRAEENLRQSEERFRRIFEQGQLGVEILGLDGQIRMLNPAICQLLGYSQEELAKSTFADITHPDDLEAEKAMIRELLAGETLYFSMDKRYLRKDGQIVWANITKSIIRDTDGAPLYFLTMFQDISERKRMEGLLQTHAQELARSNADLEKFAYVASHDLQEPLRNVASCLQMLEKKYKSKMDADADRYIHYAIDAATHMKALIEDLLEYSRIGTKGKPSKRTDCEQILDRSLINLRSAISEAGALITHDPLPEISVDDTQLKQVFQNLIANAIKFRRDEQPRVHVSAVKNKNEWIFSVKDNGIGIESQYLDRIFVIFQRLHKRDEYEGTGMGLAIVKKVVERHGGRVWVESEPGVGTTFYFTMPDKGAQA